MKKAIAIVLLGSVLMACHSDINLDNLDTTSELQLGMALPVGSVHAYIGDFVGYVPGMYVDSSQNRGVITWKGTFPIERKFHADSLDLSQMVSDATLNLNVYEHLPATMYIQEGQKRRVTGTGQPVTLPFEMPITLKGINKDDNKDRLDSALIETANFISVIKQKNNLPLKWEWIDKVTLELGEQINRPTGNTMVVYTKGDKNDYGEEIQTTIDQFTICLMKNRHLDPKTQYDQYRGNVIDSCKFYINFTFIIPDGEIVDIPEDAGFEYALKVQFIKYKAIWGKFIHSNDMYDEDEIDLSEYGWDKLDFIRHSNVPFSDPRVDMRVVTRIAGAMVLTGDYLYTKDANDQPHYATFDEAETVHRREVNFTEEQCLDPITSEIGDSTKNMVVVFDKHWSQGHIDKLFANMPQKLGYKFNVDFNYQKTPQIRITPDTRVRIEAVTTLPLMFNRGLKIEYADTLRDISLKQFDIDSLLGQVKFVDTIKTSDVFAVVKAKNNIPVHLKAFMRCLDENYNIIMDPDSLGKPLTLFQTDTISLDPPTYAYSGGNWNRTAPGETVIYAAMNKQKLNVLTKVKNIAYYVFIDDKALQYAFDRGLFNVKITDDCDLTLTIGLTANVDAIMDFEKLNQ